MIRKSFQMGLLLAFSSLMPFQAVETPFDMEGLSFMSGCWEGSFAEGGTIEEFYTFPSKNLMLGTTRYLRDGAAVQYEFTRIERTAEGIFMTPYPRGRPSPDAFQLTSLQGDRAVFEAPQHDYPKRIIYRRNLDGTRTARIDGGPQDDKGQEWRMSSVDCSGPQTAQEQGSLKPTSSSASVCR